MTPMNTNIIDLHCDSIGRCYVQNLSLISDVMHLNLNRLPENLGVCQAAAIFIPDEKRGRDAQEYFLAAHQVFLRELEAHRDRLQLLERFDRIDEALAQKPLAFFLTVEGGSVLAGDLDWVDKLHGYGVKMMTLTWNGANEICGGVRSEEGFTPFGRRAVGRMEELGMAVDVSHLNDKSFWELCQFAQKPFLASHSNSRVVCGHPRNLTDDMFREIARRGGVVGLNYFREFIAEDGKTEAMDDLLRHLHHFLELGGEDAVALGSDFDGADLPDYLDGIAKIPALIEAMYRSGLDKAVVEKVCFQNAGRYLSSL